MRAFLPSVKYSATSLARRSPLSDDVRRYFDSLASATGRVRIFTYAQTWEGRPLIYAAIGSDANLKRLPEIKAAMQKVADPRRTLEAAAKELIAKLPAVVWLGYGVHGNELSPSDAAMLTAYHVLASRGDKLVDQIIESTLLLIDPNQNPDGRERSLQQSRRGERTGAGYKSGRGRTQRTVARRTRQSLPVRLESRLVRAHAAGNTRAGCGAAGVAADRVRGPARDGPRFHLLFRS